MTGKTLAEKLIGSHTAKGSVSAGEIVIVKVDYTFSHDAAGPLLIQQLSKLKNDLSSSDKNRTVFFIDHAVPSPTKELSNDQATVRNYASINGLILSDAGNGICHQIIAEDYTGSGRPTRWNRLTQLHGWWSVCIRNWHGRDRCCNRDETKENMAACPRINTDEY